LGTKRSPFLAEKFFDDGVAATDDEEFTGVVELGGECRCDRRRFFAKRSEDVELGDGGGGAAEAGGFRGDAGAEVDEELALDFEDALVGGEDFSFVIL